MKTAGYLLREARKNKGLTIKELEEITHIKSSFIDSIEKSDWDKLPEIQTTLGFVKTLSHFLDVDDNESIPLFRREYPVRKTQKIVPKNERIGKKFAWGPRMTFAALIIIILVVVLGYLGFQYRKFNMAPSLAIYTPSEGQIIKTNNLMVTGKTDSDATVIVNEQIADVSGDGSFKSTINVSEDTKEIDVVAESRSGKRTEVKRKIVIQK